MDIARFGSMKRAYGLSVYVCTENLIGSSKVRKVMWQTRVCRDRLGRRLVQNICKLFAGEVRMTGNGGPPICPNCDGWLNRSRKERAA